MKRNTVLPARVPSSPSTADDLKVRRFAPAGLLAGLVAMVVIVLAWMMPGRMLDQLLAQKRASSVASEAYLRLLVREHPEVPSYRVELARLLVSAGRYQEAMDTLAKTGVDAPAGLDLYLTALERAYFQSEPDRRDELEKTLARLVGDAQQSPAAMKRLLKTALSLGEMEVGMRIYQRLLAGDLSQPEKKALFRSVVDTSLASGDSRAALKLACGLLVHVAGEPEVYRVMVGLARMAADSACAVHFARLLVGIAEQENRCADCSV